MSQNFSSPPASYIDAVCASTRPYNQPTPHHATKPSPRIVSSENDAMTLLSNKK